MSIIVEYLNHIHCGSLCTVLKQTVNQTCHERTYSELTYSKVIVVA